MIRTPLELRWERARVLVDNGAIQITARKGESWSALAHGSAHEPYDVRVTLSDKGKLQSCWCTCPDHVCMCAYLVYAEEHRLSTVGVPMYEGQVVCKHALGLALKAYLELEAEVLQQSPQGGNHVER